MEKCKRRDKLILYKLERASDILLRTFRRMPRNVLSGDLERYWDTLGLANITAHEMT